ncbi:fluoroquinolone export ABC transporter permease subunit [Alkaliphilus sp. B6464]|uniref:fluoroquinolone export ABC transporter permease subunit n=1 Tax=Alkaliphilus sp. B6464 TaxID=2731219 RepID=UPI001BA7B805|nr:hypothetical protein [Alkaliphilus sp. B6464]QUH19654.1 hypothetical protein HYG84_06925 [Alkaliphilus sp. B6464]
MKRLINSIKGDIALQIKYGFYTVYIVITLIYILILRYLPIELVSKGIIFVILQDPSVLGFFFIGAIILLEKSENVIEHLVCTPLTINEYIISKVISLSVLSLATSLVIVFFAYEYHVNYFLLVTGVAITSFLFILIGIVAVARFNTVNRYMWSSIPYIMVLFLPLLEHFSIIESPLFYIFPTYASLLLIRGAFYSIKLWQFLYSVVYLMLWIFLVYKWSYAWFYKYIILDQGGK